MSEISATGDAFLELDIPSKFWIEYRAESEVRSELIRAWNKKVGEESFKDKPDSLKRKERLAHERALLENSSLCGLVMKINSTHLSGDFIAEVDDLIIGSQIERDSKLEAAFKSRVKNLAAREIVQKYKDSLMSVKGSDAKKIIGSISLPDLSLFGSKEKSGKIITFSVEKGIEVTPLKT